VIQALTQLAAAGPHINIKADVLFHIGPVPVTNSMLLGILGYTFVIWAMFATARAVVTGKSTVVTKTVLMIYEMLLGTVEQVLGDKKIARRIAPLSITLFFIIIVNYWLGILPFVGPITANGVPVFRGLVADLNVTFAMAIISMLVVQIYAIKTHGLFGNLGRYFRNPIRDPAGAFEGLLELIAEVSRLLALSLRLFGNVFAGEVLIIMVGYMTQYLAGIALLPFMIFELFIGSIQAYVFFMLTTVFIGLGMVSHGEHSDDDHQKEKRVASVAPLLEA
jgi:F-type H+-transporting ATPase subunit a